MNELQKLILLIFESIALILNPKMCDAIIEPIFNNALKYCSFEIR